MFRAAEPHETSKPPTIPKRFKKSPGLRLGFCNALDFSSPFRRQGAWAWVFLSRGCR